jgi:hypothetical protein
MAEDPVQFTADHEGPEDAAGQGPAPAAAEGPRGGPLLRDLLSGNWLLAALFAAGIVCLYAMSLMRGPLPASARQTEVQSSVDDALAKLSGAPGLTADKTTAAIVETFYCEAKHRQIPASSLRGNPFVFQILATEAPATRPATEAKAAPPAETTRESEAMSAASGLRLQSVLMGARQNAALISDNLLTEGQVILGWTVTQILPREVHLTWKDKTRVLKMRE